MNTEQPVIYFNPKCSKSRKTLELIESKGYSPEIIDYIDQPPSADTLKSIRQMLDIPFRDLLRSQEQVFKDAGLDEESLSDEEILEAITGCPSLLQRPIVVFNGQAILGRPPENVLDIL